MKYSLDIRIVSDNQVLLDALKNKVPSKLDSTIWADEYEVVQTDNVVSIMVRFNDTADRQTILNWIKTKAQNNQADILTGSYVAYHLCDHDLGNGKTGCGPRIILWSK